MLIIFLLCWFYDVLHFLDLTFDYSIIFCTADSGRRVSSCVITDICTVVNASHSPPPNVFSHELGIAEHPTSKKELEFYLHTPTTYVVQVPLAA